MSDLIARLESGPGSRELSDECLLAVGFTRVPGKPTMWTDPNGDFGGGDGRPDPSRNVQDAITHMVPAGYGWVRDPAGSMGVYNKRRKAGDMDPVVFWSEGSRDCPAPALSAASIRAHAAMKESDDG